MEEKHLAPGEETQSWGGGHASQQLQRAQERRREKEAGHVERMKRVASPGSMHDTRCLGLVHWDDPEGRYGEGGGQRVQDGEHVYTGMPGN